MLLTATASGEVSPPVQLPRRMWAGSQIQFHSPITLGETLTRQSTIEHIRETTGRSGALTFVKVRHEIGQSSVLLSLNTEPGLSRGRKTGRCAAAPLLQNHLATTTMN